MIYPGQIGKRVQLMKHAIPHDDSYTTDDENVEGYKPMSLAETQEMALRVLDELDSFCQKHSITYYLIGGSLIGAVRSQVLVPWDDDIDVAMKRVDYERFCREYEDNEKYKLYHYKRVDGYRHGMAKLCDTATVFVEPTTRDLPYGVFVDIFPLDEVVSVSHFRTKWMSGRIKRYNYAHVVNAKGVHGSILKNAIRLTLSLTIGRIPYARAASRIDDDLAKGRGQCIVNLWGGWGIREHASKACFDDTVRVTLRGKAYYAPSGYDEWLTNLYGDYMSPPVDPPHYHGSAYRIDPTPTGGRE